MLGSTPILASPHPSPLSASRGFFGSRPFSRANAILTEMGAAPVGRPHPDPLPLLRSRCHTTEEPWTSPRPDRLSASWA